MLKKSGPNSGFWSQISFRQGTGHLAGPCGPCQVNGCAIIGRRSLGILSMRRVDVMRLGCDFPWEKKMDFTMGINGTRLDLDGTRLGL